MNEYPNIFVSTKTIGTDIGIDISIKNISVCHKWFWYKHISGYICIKKNDTNEYSNIFVYKKLYKIIYKQIFVLEIFEYSNIQIYLSYSGLITII